MTNDSSIGVGPHPRPWPDDDRLDPVLLAEGDRRNVVDRYRYWSVDAIVADLDTSRHPVHVAIENWEHDFNIGTVVRNANAFNVAAVHVIGPHRWDRRGAMSTHRYLHLHHHPDVDAFAAWSDAASLPIVAIDNVTEARPIESARLPEACVMLFGQEGPGLSPAARGAAAMTCEITQYGSTRSLNAGVASGIALFAWAMRHEERNA
ncbi:MAG: TrmH family RNA methyltransferase [Ilumatobacter sp.]